MRRLLMGIVAVLAAVLAAALLLLGAAHLDIRSVRPELPTPAALLASPADADLPTGIFVVETARQPMPRSAVLDPASDPDPAAPYVMTHPSFVLAWPDGRLFLIDVGMDRAAALAFGAPLTRLAGAERIQPLGSVAEQLGPAASRVRGIGFTHLHTDHTAGLAALCAVVEARIPVFQTPEQHRGGNYTTRAGRAQIAAARCATPTPVDAAPLAPIPGFPGLFVTAVGGHTPGSQMFAAHVRSGGTKTLWIFTGDVVNHRDAVAHDLPKPWLYSLLVVPEAGERLGVLRRLLATLAAEPNVKLAISHDASGLAALGAPAWPARLSELTRR